MIPNYKLMEEPVVASKDDANIIAVWKQGQADTVDIARRFRTTEAHVYRVISQGRGLNQ